MVTVCGRAYCIHRESLPDFTPGTRRQVEQRVSRAVAVVEALSAAVRRSARTAPDRGRESVQAPTLPLARRHSSLGARLPASQRGATRALFASAPDVPQLAQLRQLATTSQGLHVDLVTFTGCPYNAAGAHCWGSSWAALHGRTQLARGSCSALTFNPSAALLAVAQRGATRSAPLPWNQRHLNVSGQGQHLNQQSRWDPRRRQYTL